MLWLVLLLVPAGVGAGAASACSCCCCVMMMMLMLLRGALAAARCCFEVPRGGRALGCMVIREPFKYSITYLVFFSLYRFPEVAELLDVWWLEISGKIDAHLLSPKTTYKAYLVIKLGEEAYGLDYPAETSIKLGDHASNKIAILQPNGTIHRLGMWDSEESVSNRVDGQVPQARCDGWMEIEMGEFFNDEGEEGDIEMSFMEVKGGRKSGLIVEGIEMRPVCE